ncbi:hypothetical protein D1871_15470 [Nakamurella silvestris]|nr:hypothetical protein D1871_15470 [Nakamurella silvestris]
MRTTSASFPSARSRASLYRRWGLVLVTAALTAGSLGAPSAAAGAPVPAGPDDQLSAVPVDTAGAPVVGTTVVGTTDGRITLSGYADDDGYHLQTTTDGRTWHDAAVLSPAGADGTLTGYQCLSGDGRYAAVAVLPTAAVSDNTATDRGAYAYAVDLRTGVSTLLPQRVGLMYFSPGCGLGNTAVFTRYTGTDQAATELLTADLATGTLSAAVPVTGQVTSAVPTATGLVGVQGSALVSITGNGSATPRVRVDGLAYQLHPAADGGITYLTTSGDRSTATAVHLDRAGTTTLGTGSTDTLQLLGDGDRQTLIGATTIRTAALERASVTLASGDRLIRAAAAVRPTAAVRAAASKTTPTNSVCAVNRLDPAIQVLQPTAAQADWAGQLAAQNLLVGSAYTRKAGFSGMVGMPAYAPNKDFPAIVLKHPAGTTWNTVPRSVVSAVMAQESNLRQASRYTPSGVPGGPLIGNYYGSNPALTAMNPADADCGYGIMQVTSGMRTTDKSFTANGKKKVAVDYQENIAAGLQILQGKWNQLYSAGIIANDGSPKYLENWYFALWAYNSGIQLGRTDCSPAPTCTDVEKAGGLSWTNNPANPKYPPGRKPFLRDSYNDAKTPANWPYQERVLGWMGQPQIVNGKGAYPKPTYNTGTPWLKIPPTTAFCTPAGNNCTPSSTNPTTPSAGFCQSTTLRCWWSSPVKWVTTGKGAVSTYRYGKGSKQPASPTLKPAASCKVSRSAVPVGSIIVDNQNSRSKNLRGCTAGNANWSQGGTFTYRYGTNAAGKTMGAVDTHQMGSGLGGHSIFTHSDDGKNPALVNTGTWTPKIKSAWAGKTFRVKVLLPAYAADARGVVYTVKLGPGRGSKKVRINQGGHAEQWVTLGTYKLWPGASVTLTNAGTNDSNGLVAFDAVAFTVVKK